MARRQWSILKVFFQNKANLRKSQVSASRIFTRAYEKKANWTLDENKPKQSQFQNSRQKTEFRKQKPAQSPFIFSMVGNAEHAEIYPPKL